MKQLQYKDLMLTEEQILKIIKKYISKNETNYAILLDGEWGTGKTYFIREKLIPLLKKDYKNEKKEKNKVFKLKNKTVKFKNKKPIYISLYGIEDVKEISKSIYISLLGEKNNKWISAPINITQFLNPDIDYSKITEVLEQFIQLENNVIIFDDLERCNIDINLCLGYINNLVEHNNIKVIIVANEKEIGKLNYDKNYELKLITAMNKDINYNDPEIKDIFGEKKKVENDINNIVERARRIFKNGELYKIIKEKLIGKTIYYRPNITEIFNSLINSDDIDENIKNLLNKKRQYIIERLEYNNCTNIRTVKFIIEVINEIGIILNTIDIKEKDKEMIYDKLILYIIDDCVMFKTTGKIYNWDKDVEFDTITLKGDGYASYLDYITGFRFVDMYIKQGIINQDYVEKSIKGYLEAESYQINDENDPYYKLSIYWELEDQEIIEYLNLIEKNLRNGEYSVKLFPKMIKTFSSIENLNFQVEKIEQLITIMKEQILENNAEYIDWHTMIEKSEVAEIYNKNTKILKEAIDQKGKEKEEIELNEIINNMDWGIKLNDYCYEKKDVFLGDKMFLAKLNIDKIINNINKSNSKNIYHFKYCIDRIYNFSNLREFYEKDIPNLEKLIIGLEELNTAKYGVTKKEAIEYLIKILKDKLKILNGEYKR